MPRGAGSTGDAPSGPGKPWGCHHRRFELRGRRLLMDTWLPERASFTPQKRVIFGENELDRC